MRIIRSRDFNREIADSLANLGLWFLGVVAWMTNFAPLPRDARLWLQRQLIYTRREIRLILGPRSSRACVSEGVPIARCIDANCRAAFAGRIDALRPCDSKRAASICAHWAKCAVCAMTSMRSCAARSSASRATFSAACR